MSSRGKVELHLPINVVYPVPRFLIIRVDMPEPADTATRHGLEEFALRIQESVIRLNACEETMRSSQGRRIRWTYSFVRNICNSVGAIRFDTWVCHRRPPVLAEPNLLSIPLFDKVVEVRRDDRPRLITCHPSASTNPVLHNSRRRNIPVVAF